MTTWQRTFEVSATVERAWSAFTELEAAREQSDEHTMLEVVPEQKLRWSQGAPHLPEKAEFTVVFESVVTGTRITVTRHGFGTDEAGTIFAESNGLGWEHGFMDLMLYIETGVVARRHYYGVSKSATGVMYRETDVGLEVRAVRPGSFGDKTGLASGDILLRLAGVPVFKRSDLWVLNIEHEPGTEVVVEFVRDGKVRSARAELGGYPDAAAVGE